ncbi:MAG TPA: PAS domain S-box protein [Candidatus Paceibacterota bacterium]|nr:PAS domain S-box protein [Candidatus Paceibacterota bacterium]
MATQGQDQRFRAIAEAAHDIIFVVESDGTVSYANPYAARWLGMSADQIIGRRQQDLFSPSTAASQGAAIQKVLETGQPFSSESISEVGGLRRYLETNLTPLLDDRGRVTAVVGVSRDITESRAAAERLRISEERFRALVEHSDEVIVINDQEGKRLFVSASVERVLGYTPQEYLAQTIFDMAYPDDLPALHKLFADANATPRKPIEIVLRIRHKDGSWRWIHSIVTNLLDLPAIGGLVVNLHDITELRRAQEAQARASELERIANIMTGRELKMAELKREIERLRHEKGA